MNLLAKIALLVGRKKFEEFARANPPLPDDALAIANTLATYPVRGAALLVAGSLARAVDNLLRGTETINLTATHVLLMLAGLCIIWVRHAISKHDIRLNQVVQQARAVSGISSKTLPLLVALGLGAWLLMSPADCRAADPSANPLTNNISVEPLTRLLGAIANSTKFSSGVGINFHAQVAPLLSQELALFGHTGTNSSWSTGPSHATFFLPAENQEQLGWSLSGSWQSPPPILRLALFNASDIDWTVNWGMPVEDYSQFFQRIDWRENRLGLSVTRKF